MTDAHSQAARGPGSRARAVAALAARLAQAAPIEPDQPVEVGVFRPADALWVSGLYLDAYGPDFPLDWVYHPEELARRLTGPDQKALVARTPRGEVVAVAGVFRAAPWSGLFESGQLIVHRAYRQGVLGFNLLRLVHKDLLPGLGADGVFGEAVCHHTATQAMCLSEGYGEGALFLDALPGARPAPGMVCSPRISLVSMFKIFRDNPGTVFVPERWRDLIREMHGRLGLHRTLADPGAWADPEAAASQASLTIMAAARTVRLHVARAGADLARRVDQAQAEAGEGGWTQVFLNLADPAAPRAAEALRARGYFLAGILPLWFGSDALALQRHPGQPDYPAIRLFSKPAKALLETVRLDREAMLAGN